MPTLMLNLLPKNKIKIVIKADNRGAFLEVIDNLKTIPVIKFVKDALQKYYETSIYHLDSVYEMAQKNGYELYITDNVEESSKRTELKFARYKKLKQCTEFKSDLWTDDKEFKILPYQAQAVNLVFSAKRFLIGDDMGCLAEGTVVIMNGRHYNIEDIYKRFNKLETDIHKNWHGNIRRTRSLFEDGTFYLNDVLDVIYSGEKETIELVAKSEHKEYRIRLTEDHLLLSSGQWIPCGTLNISDEIKVNGKEMCYCEVCKEDTEIITYKHSKFLGKCKKCMYRFHKKNTYKQGFLMTGNYKYVTAGIRFHPHRDTVGVMYHRLVYEAYLNNKTIEEWLEIIKFNRFDNNSKFLTPEQIIHHKDNDPNNNDISNLELTSKSEHMFMHSAKNRSHLPYTVPENAKIIEIIKDRKIVKTYDIKMKGPNHNFIANGIVVHNCGKTIEAIGVMCKALEDGYKKILIFCPNRLKYQWKSEILKFTKIPENYIYVVDPYVKFEFKCPLKKVEKVNFIRLECKKCTRFTKCKNEKYNPKSIIQEQFKNHKIIICNYEVMDKHKDLFISIKPDGIILDEATRIKNMNALTTKAVINVVKTMPSDALVIPMSGTFIENRLEEIYPPLTLINDGILGEYHNFKNNYLVFDYWGNVIGYRNENKLKKLLDKFIIRRSVDEVWEDRPKLIEIIENCPMTPKQHKVYVDARDGVLKELADKETEKKINFAEIGALIMYLIQICDSAETMDPMCNESGKLEVLKDKLENEIPKHHKILIFSFFANKMIPLIQREVSKYGKSLVITGKTKPEEAEKIKLKFKEDPKMRFLICSDSMAYGANLQEARYVVNFDLPWNPAKLDQRIRRVYRKGQKHTVNVLNLVTPGTVEDKILEKLSSKRKLFDYLLGYSTVKKQKSLSLNDMLDIIKSGKP